jgi:hypothetical protein
MGPWLDNESADAHNLDMQEWTDPNYYHQDGLKLKSCTVRYVT